MTAEFKVKGAYAFELEKNVRATFSAVPVISHSCGASARLSQKN